MAYMSQELKAKLVTLTKPILFKYGLKGTFKVENHVELVLTLKSGKINFQSFVSRPFRTAESLSADYFEKGSIAFKAIKELHQALNVGNHNNSDSQTDYFDIGWGTRISLGSWESDYIFDPNLK